MEDLARLSIKNKPVWVGVDDAEQESTVDGLEQVSFLVLLVRFFASFCPFRAKGFISEAAGHCAFITRSMIRFLNPPDTGLLTGGWVE